MLAPSGHGAGARYVRKYGAEPPEGVDAVSTHRRQTGRWSSDSRGAYELRRPLEHAFQLQHVPDQVASDDSHQRHCTDWRTNQHTGRLRVVEI